MPIPNLSKSLDVAELRHIQSIHESPCLRGPDTLVRHLLPMLCRARAAWISKTELYRLRTIPFYYYLLARTRYYDQVFTEVLSEGVKRILNMGCGSDTRAYRFMKLLCDRDVRVLECDQADIIDEKQRIVKRWGDDPCIRYLAVNLNDRCWPELERWLGPPTGPKTLVLMEGVSPYIETGALINFLQLLGAKLAPGSQVVYDFKLIGVNDDLGCGGGVNRPFRLPSDRSEVAWLHKQWGLHLEDMETSAELCVRLIPSLRDSQTQLFEEDVLVRLSR